MRFAAVIARHTRNATAMRAAADDSFLHLFLAGNNHLTRELWNDLVARRPALRAAQTLVRERWLDREDMTHVLRHETRKAVLEVAVHTQSRHLDDDLVRQILVDVPSRLRRSILDDVFCTLGERTDHLSTDVILQAADISPEAKACFLTRRASDAAVACFLANVTDTELARGGRALENALPRLLAERPNVIEAAINATNVLVGDVAAASRHLLDAGLQRAVGIDHTAGFLAAHFRRRVTLLAENPTLHPEVAAELLRRAPEGTLSGLTEVLTNAATGRRSRLAGPLETERDPRILQEYVKRIENGTLRTYFWHLFDLIPLLSNPHLGRGLAVRLSRSAPSRFGAGWAHGRTAYAPYTDAAALCALRFPGVLDTGDAGEVAAPRSTWDKVAAGEPEMRQDRSAVVAPLNAAGSLRRLGSQVQFLDQAVGNNEQMWRNVLALTSGAFAGTAAELVAIAECLSDTAA